MQFLEKNIIGVVLSIFLFPCISEAQNRGAAINVSEPYEVIDAEKEEFYDLGEEGIVAIKQEDQTIYAQAFSKRPLKETGRTEVDFSKRDGVYEGFMKFQEQVLVFHSLKKKESGVEQLFYQRVKPGSASLTDPIHIADIGQTLDGEEERKMIFWKEILNKFSLFPNSNKDKLLVTFDIKEPEEASSGQGDSVGYLVLNNQLELKRKVVKQLPFSRKNMGIIDYGIDEKNQIFLLVVIRKKTSEENYKFLYQLLQLKEDGAWKKIPLNLNKPPVSMDLNCSEKGINYLHGYYGSLSNATPASVTVTASKSFPMESHFVRFSIDRDPLNARAKGLYSYSLSPSGDQYDFESHGFSEKFRK